MTVSFPEADRDEVIAVIDRWADRDMSRTTILEDDLDNIPIKVKK